MDVLWRWPELCRALSLEEIDGPDVTGISIDSRTLAAGDLFIALSGDPGPRFNAASATTRDGHAYVPSALLHGAAGLLVNHPTRTGAPELLVEDTLDGLWALGRVARARLTGLAVAVTGSSGKTTVKAFLAAALGCPAAQGSLNNFWGVPLTLARTPASAACAIYEIGTNHPGEIAPLAELVQPDVAVVLNVLPAHLEFFDSIDVLRREKLSIAQGLRPGGTLVLPDDLQDDLDVDGDFERVRFGRGPRADVRLVQYTATSHQATFEIGAETCTAHVPGGGEHRALSLAATMACLVALDRSPLLACDLGDALIPPGRGARLDAGGLTLIDDSYNANPVSMRAALEELAAEPEGRRFALLGEMLELGDASAAYHADLAGACAGLDGVLCVGEAMRGLHDALPSAQQLGWHESVAGVDLDALLERFAAGDRILIKGSNRVFWAQDFVAHLTRMLHQRE